MFRRTMLAVSVMLMPAAATLASDAETSASAGSSRFNRNGTASATARYEGDLGFARTRTNSGRLNTARGVAVGVDRDGISLSVSNAVAPRNGPALATTFNLSIGRDGSVQRSAGLSVANGPLQRSATAGGAVSTGHNGRDRIATAHASGRTDRFGRVNASTRSHSSRSPRLAETRQRPVRRVAHRSDPREVRRYRAVRR